ncbi:ph-response sensor protein [Aspergillus nanangensis]|uniref:Ph-response sensor protein n=1 Tax=Aspergillus nanangensis TaxID=2582783 RepID=A0AAD4CQQ9_ASPNN|nr:ph-response sensor protein [Aspergillus nanangensis]
MPPKPKLSRSAKQALIVSHLRSTGTCHTLKELEKMLPSVASINGMQVKEYVQELLDENQMRCEKIGNGNWYWCFDGGERKQRENERAQLQGEVERAQVEGECQRLREALRQYEPEQGNLGVATMRQEIKRWKGETERWTENVYMLEAYVRRLAQGDGEVLRDIQRECYGDEFRSQLGQRNRNINDFYIEPDDPWRSYFPGDVIKGTVVLTLSRPLRITHLVVCLHGYVKVFKNTVPSGEVAPEMGFLGPGRGRRGAEYLGNGLATLFEDEVVLCGDGRLKEGIYKFRFEMSFPPYALPSSISFERGTITYMLTSTLTKPTTMNPTISCRKRVNLLENIDIAPFPAPRARVITLEPVSKRSKSKAKGKSVSSDAGPDSASLGTSVNGGASDHRPPLSPAPSNESSSSHLSNSSQSFQIASDPSSSTSTGMRNSEARSITPSLGDKTITAKAEVLRAGVLPGDSLPIKVTINHCKQVRSAHGIILTLYRQGRIDLHPSIPIGRTADGKKPVYEDIYPRSRTGLGGLTIGTSRTSSVFRKDLTQAFAPLVVDPSNLTAIVKTSIRIPEDAFPTITRTPGSMINFRYYVEVVVDLRGKLTSPERFLPRFNMVSSGSNFSPSGQVLNPPDISANSITANWAGNILDTDRIRREKGVVAVAFEVVIGTRDSHRRQNRAKRTSSTAAGSDVQSSGEPHPPDLENWPESTMTNADAAQQEDYGFPQEPYYSEYADEPQQPYQSLGEMVSAPQSEEPVDEKARLRRAEQMLLPSQPPDEAVAGPSTEMGPPTAPVLPDDDHLHDYQHLPSPTQNGVPPAVISAGSVHTVVAGNSSNSMTAAAAEQSSDVLASDDKQELERQRLMMEASAPDDVDNPLTPSHNNSTEAPSAPVFHDDVHDHQLVGGTAHGDEALPRYQR